jgi:UPF0755 protein
MKKLLVVFIFFILLVGVFLFINPFSAPSNDSKIETFVVPEVSEEAVVIKDLKDKGFIKSFLALDLVLTLKNKHDKVSSGGYYLSKNMNAIKIADIITSQPDLKWVTLVEGLRKEQIGERLQKALGWSNQELNKWNSTYTAMSFDNFEGVYFPDTYLIPVKENGLEVAQRMINHFNEKAATYINGFAKKDILWTSGIKIASLIQREAAGKQDMSLISGILWNRLLKGQKLQIDATVQYVKGKSGDWWPVVTSDDITSIDSPYNTYEFKGLPVHPIANPGLDAINAALNPAKTDCIYYLHDHNRQIHCAVTYQEHLENIKKYLN